MTYQYSVGDRLSDRNTYFYTKFGGEPFLTSWQTSREEARAELGAPIRHSGAYARTAQPPSSGEFSTVDLLGYLRGELCSDTGPETRTNTTLELSRWLDRLVQRFEVSKRVYVRYRWTDRGLRAVRESGFDQLELYLGAAEVFERAYGRYGRAQFLNALLKVNDTLVATRHRLEGEQRNMAAALLGQENEHVVALAATVGVSW